MNQHAYPRGEGSGIASSATPEYIIGLKIDDRSESLTIDAEDALNAALMANHHHPDAIIAYVRKRGLARRPSA
jgi:hypothetical protein